MSLEYYYQPTFIASLLLNSTIETKPCMNGYVTVSCTSMLSNTHSFGCAFSPEIYQHKCSLSNSLPKILVNRDPLSISTFCNFHPPLWDSITALQVSSVYPLKLNTGSNPNSLLVPTPPFVVPQHDKSITSLEEFHSYLQLKTCSKNSLTPKTDKSKVQIKPNGLIPLTSNPFIKKHVIICGDCAVLPHYGLKIHLPNLSRKRSWKVNNLIQAIAYIYKKKWSRNRAVNHFHVPYPIISHYINHKLSYIK